MTLDPAASDPPPPDPAARPRRRAPLIAGAVAAAGLALAYGPNLGQLARTWWNEPDYSHAFLVPVVALLIARRRLGGGVDLRPSWSGLAILAAILGVRALCFERGDFWLETATILPAVAALVLAVGGWALLRRTWPAVAFLAFMLTIPGGLDAQLSRPLQRIAAVTSGKVLRLLGLWIVEDGNVLDLGDERLEVATACNGLAMLMSLSATVAAIVLLVPMTRGKRAALLLSAIPIALLCNILRIMATAYCYEQFGSESGRKFAHDAAGWLMMPLALALIGLELAWASWLFRRRELPPSDGRPMFPDFTAAAR